MQRPEKKEQVGGTQDESSADFPMRINRYLALQGVATRRGADELVSRGRVFVNDKRAVLGQTVDEGDRVEVKKAGRGGRKLRYYAYNKPDGIVTHSPTEQEDAITDLLPDEMQGQGLFPVGRLDKDSHGLIILTNDGRVTNRLLAPEYEHEKEYIVKTKLPIRGNFKQYLEEGVAIEGYLTKPTQVRVLGDNRFSIVLTEGKKHQIRRMVVALKNEVIDLKRIRVMNVLLGNLSEGSVRPVEGAELERFLEMLGLPALP